MSVTTPTAPDVSLNETGDWDIASALADLTNITLPTGRSADLPLEESGDQPAPAVAEPVKPTAPGEDPKAASQPDEPSTAEEAAASAVEPDEETARYTEKQYQRSRAEANRQRDLAAKDAADALAQLQTIQKQSEENEFQRGVMLLADQYIDRRLAEVGAVTPAEVQQIRQIAWQEMANRRAQWQQTEQARQAQEALRTQTQTLGQSSAQHAAQTLFLEQAFDMQAEANAVGLGTYDVKTAMMDVINTDKYQRRKNAINAIGNGAEQKAAAVDFYEDVKAIVRAKISKVAQVKENPKNQPKAAAPSTVPTQAAQAPTNFLKVDESTFEDVFGARYSDILAANPQLRLNGR
jgi:phage FluMu protein gp41